MPVLRIQGFSGVIPVTGDRALPDSAATKSQNTWLYANELRGLRPPVLVVENSVATRKVFRIPDRAPGDSPSDVMAASTWKEFDHPDTDIVRGQLLEDQYERYYFCSPSTGPVYNTYARLSAGLDDYKLGVPGPNADLDAAGNNAAKPIITNIEAYNVSENVYEIEFKIAATAGAATAYTNPGGKGDRTAIITMSGTTQFSSAMNGLINGVTTSGPTITNLADANKTIVFDFVTDKKIDEITWYQKGSRGYGDWEFQRSTDGTTWVKLGTAVMGGAPKVSYSVANTAVYRYYRLFQKDPTDSLNVTRAYVYTWVNEFGEESTPSLPATGAGDSMGVWTVTNITDPPPNPQAEHANYSHKYLYRTVSGASGQTTYYRVTEGKYESGTAIPQGGKIALGETVVIDNSANLTDAEIVNNLTLESTSWSLPPDDLQGFIAMPNGFLIGFDGSHVYMSEAYHWHAWPAEYKQAVETPIVGLGILGQTCVVCTQGYPATITGSKPAICSFTKATAGEPCLSRGSIVSTTHGVLYASQNGLVLVGPGGIQNVTEQLITRGKWLRYYAPDKIRAVTLSERLPGAARPAVADGQLWLLPRPDGAEGGAHRADRVRYGQQPHRRLLVGRGVPARHRHGAALGPADRRPDAGGVAVEGIPVPVPGELRLLRHLLGPGAF